MPESPTYESIILEASTYALKYRQEHEVPPLPTAEQLHLYQEIINSRYVSVTQSIKEKLLGVKSDGGHGYEHLDDVAKRAAFIANLECNRLEITGQKKQEVINLTVLAGLLHDIERHLGFGRKHQDEGEKTARQILTDCSLLNEKVLSVVLNHDEPDYLPGNDIELQIIYGSLFDADHFRWGLEREDTFWEMKQGRGVTPKQVIHDYAFLPPLRNIWKTQYGQEVGPKYIDFGLAIAQHIEQMFSIPAVN